MPIPSSPRNRVEETLEPKRIFLVATEDNITGAYAYFDELSQTERYRFLNKYTFKIKVIPSVDGKSSPNYILDNLKQEIKNKGMDLANNDADQLWIICDTDNWEKENIEEVISDCEKISVSHAFSNPCFEIWLLFHQQDFNNTTFPNSAACKAAAQALITKRKGYENLITQQQIDYAITRSTELDKQTTGKWPATQTTHVYKIMNKLMSN